jgi:hypothetical protein
MTEPSIESQIKHMVDRFLGWRLPHTFSPDDGISFDPVGNKGTPYEYRRQPTGTNLLDAVQAEEMVRYMLESGVPTAQPSQSAISKIFASVEDAAKFYREQVSTFATDPQMVVVCKASLETADMLTELQQLRAAIREKAGTELADRIYQISAFLNGEGDAAQIASTQLRAIAFDVLSLLAEIAKLGGGKMKPIPRAKHVLLSSGPEGWSFCSCGAKTGPVGTFKAQREWHRKHKRIAKLGEEK